MLEFLKIRKGELFRNCFTVDIVDSDYSFLCILYKDEWLVYNKISSKILCNCSSRIDCISMLNYYFGLPF